MRKLALAIGALVVLMAASFVSPIGALAASAPNVARVLGPDSGARPPRGRVHTPSTRLPSTSTVISPFNCDAGYHFVASPNGPAPNFLVATAAINAGDIWAVGNSTSASGYDQNLAMHWNGVNWTIFPTPNFSAFHNDFNAVAAISTNDVWAVGEYWVDGGPSMVNIFAEHWDGTAWTNVAMTQPAIFNFLFGVTAISSTNVWAVGTRAATIADTLVEHWNGTSWTLMSSAGPSPTDNELFSVSAFSATDVFVVGEQSVPNGPFQTLAEHWDGTTWATLIAPNLGIAGSSNEILGVNALEAGHAVGVGYGYFTTDVNGNTVTPRQGAAWDLLAAGGSTGSTRSGPGTGDNALVAVDRSGPGVWAVGFWRNTVAGPRQNMVFPATWDATSHTLTWGAMGASDSPSSINNALLAVSAISPYTFWAAGYDTNSLNAAQTLTEGYCAPHFTMTGPASTPGGSSFSLTVKVQNGDGMTRTGYLGTVHFTSTDGSATLPPNYMFVSGDNGVHTFSGVVLRTGGNQAITVADLVMPLTVPAEANVTVCIGACQAPAGTAGSRSTGQSSSGTAGGRGGVNQSGAGVPGPRLPSVAQPAQRGENAAAVSAAASRSTAPESAPPTAGAAAAAATTTPVKAPADRVVSLAAQSEPVSRPPEPTPWNVLLLIPLVVSTLALVALRRRRIKEKSNARI